MTTGSGQLKFVAYEDLGMLGSGESTPVFVEWRWRYFLSSLSLWGLILLLLVLVGANRNRQAVMVALPLFVVVGLSQALGNDFGFVFGALTLAWAIVVLLGHRLSRLPRPAAFLAAWAVMLGAGAVACVEDYGMEFSRQTVEILFGFGLVALGLLMAASLTARCCRRNCQTHRVMLWLFAWDIVLALVGMGGIGVFTFMAMQGVDAEGMAFILPGLLIVCLFGGVIFGGGVYLASLPFMTLVYFSPFYRQRLKELYRIEDQAASPFADTAGRSPFAEEPISVQRLPEQAALDG